MGLFSKKWKIGDKQTAVIRCCECLGYAKGCRNCNGTGKAKHDLTLTACTYRSGENEICNICGFHLGKRRIADLFDPNAPQSIVHGVIWQVGGGFRGFIPCDEDGNIKKNFL